jgi:SAM-dependent methyltransferase
MTATAARALWREGKAADALALAWSGYTADDASCSALVSAILCDDPLLLREEHRADFIRLLSDPRVDPGTVTKSGWHLLQRTGQLAGEGEDLAARLEHNALALALLREDIVDEIAAERVVTAVRRWLLLEHRARDFPRLSAALVAQAALNGGAWPFADDERARLAGTPDFAPAYLPSRRHGGCVADFSDATTRAVAEQYEAWPYPTWTRAAAERVTTLATLVRRADPDGPDTIGTSADILIAGCGSGRQLARSALRLPRDRLTAIDISQASLAEARMRCEAHGITGVDYRALDLHDVSSLGRSFDAVFCTGVLHHLPDPERGWAALADVLKPGGVMHVMLYSRAGRMRVRGLQRFLGRLAEQPVDNNVLREVRRRVMTLPPAAIPPSRDFFSLAGVHDLLLHRHEDPFDIPRVRDALAALGLRLIRIDFSRPALYRRYAELCPGDPLRRNMDGWLAMEKEDPTAFQGMYDFWCRKDA